mmetsp:Transcript_21202/g.47546  ORF Transcript_21202/g.47546 Transcript_21202/m.47546 type:complete len:118 (+) Transcript_21202:73-426(+)|eukprot:3571706-Amphidinium_carterae.2
MARGEYMGRLQCWLRLAKQSRWAIARHAHDVRTVQCAQCASPCPVEWLGHCAVGCSHNGLNLVNVGLDVDLHEIMMCRAQCWGDSTRSLYPFGFDWRHTHINEISAKPPKQTAGCSR